jgi:2-aminoethylphosphonate-pyruvate transaminase
VRPDLILFTPGPVRIPSLVAEYLAHPPCNYHRQDAFSRMFAETEQSLKKLVGIKHADAYFSTILTATGTGANEGCIYALEPLGKGLLLSNGFFGARVIDQARQAGVNFTALESPQDKPIDVDAVVKAIESDRAIKWLWFVSHETRTGLRNPFEAIGQAAKSRGLYVAADSISSAYAYPIDIEASQVDLVTASSAKAIQAAPGLGIVFTKKASVAALSGLKTPARSYYLDVIAEYKKQSADLQPRFAQPVALHAALRAACMHIEKSGGIDAHFARIQRQMQALIDHLAPIGVHPLLDAKYRSNIAVNFRLPVGMPYSDFSRRMEEQGYFCLYGIPGDPSHFQLSTIGDLDDAQIAGAKQALSRVFGR